MRRPDFPPKARTTFVALALIVLIFVAACSDGRSDREILVFAASSLTDAFSELAEAFEETQRVKVNLNFASSSTLATQILEGAPAAVYASANEAQMQRVLDSGRAKSSAVFATNRLVVVIPADGSPVTSFGDISKPGVRLVLAASEVPVGAYARRFVSAYDEAVPGFRESVLANLASEEPNVRAALTKVQLGEADAGIVYATDASIALDDVLVFAIPDEFNVVATYPITTIVDSDANELASRFVEFVLGREGQAILRSHGFGPPSPEGPGAAP